jgi:carbon monoxide dehydrogenase subunit G
MEFKNEFDVNAPIDQVSQALLDLEKVAPAMPGAQVLEKVDDDNYKVAIKVKVGPMSMQYRGDVEFADKDPEAHRAVMKVKAREARGQGNATADVTQQLEERDGTTHVTMNANVQLAGRAAAMGGSMIQEVSAKLVDQFANNLGEMLARPAVPAGNGGAPAAAAAQSEAPPSEAPQPAAPQPGAATEQRDPAATATAPPAGATASGASAGAAADDVGVDALGIAASLAADRLRNPRVLLGSLGIVLLLGWLFGRRGAR